MLASKDPLACGLTALPPPLPSLLQGHPGLTSLDLSHNNIADRGGLALTALLNSNRRITQLNLEGTPLLK